MFERRRNVKSKSNEMNYAQTVTIHYNYYSDDWNLGCRIAHRLHKIECSSVSIQSPIETMSRSISPLQSRTQRFTSSSFQNTQMIHTRDKLQSSIRYFILASRNSVSRVEYLRFSPCRFPSLHSSIEIMMINCCSTSAHRCNRQWHIR